MAFYDKFPYTNFQELNLDRLIHEMIEVKEGLNFVIENASLKYADPLQWNITHQYAANTVVIDPETGIAYISTKPVPDNILITNTGYWTPIFDLSALFEDIEGDIGNLETGLNTANNNISANTAAIETNADNISANTAAIGTNADAISANTTAIGNNTEAIADINADLLLNVPENAKLHGVVGDGTTDDTAAIQAVINDYPWVYFPPGEYLIEQTVTIPRRHTISGQGTSVFKCGSNNMIMFQMERQARIENLRFNATVGTISADIIIHVIDRDCTIDRITTDGGKTVVRVGNSTNDTNCLYMNDSTLNNYTFAALDFWRSNDCYFTNVLTNSNNTTATGCLMTHDLYCEAHTFANCSFLMGDRSLMVLEQKCRFCRFANCYFDSANQVFLNAGDGFSFSNCWFSNRGGNGVLMGNTTNIEFNGCTFKNCSPYGVHVASTCKGTIINGCTFNRCETAGLNCNGSSNVITGNVFNNFGSTGPEMPRGINGNPINGVIANNVFTGVTSGLPASSTDLIVQNNAVIA